MLSMLILAALAAGPEFEAQLNADEKIAGQLVELSANRTVLETPSGRRDVHGQAAELRRAQAAEPAPPPVTVYLEAATSLAANDFRAAEGKAETTLVAGGVFASSDRSVQGVFFRQNAPAGFAWKMADQPRAAEDILVIRKQDATERLSGVLGDVTADTVKFQLDGEWVSVKRSKVVGIVYAPPAAAAELPPSFCTLTDSSGARIAAAHVAIADGQAQVETPAGLKFSIPLERLDSVRFGQFLSDLQPQRAVFTPLVGGRKLTKAEELFFEPRLNRSLEPGGLRLGDRVYAKGLAMHSRSELVFRLPGAFLRFQALAGIDDSVRPAGNVRLTIYGDDRLLVEEVITGRNEPRRLDVDIRGVARLKIVADFNGDEVSDHLDLCEARILE